MTIQISKNELTTQDGDDDDNNSNNHVIVNLYTFHIRALRNIYTYIKPTNLY